MWREILYSAAVVLPILGYFVLMYFAPISLEGGFMPTKFDERDSEK